MSSQEEEFVMCFEFGSIGLEQERQSAERMIMYELGLTMKTKMTSLALLTKWTLSFPYLMLFPYPFSWCSCV